MWARRPLPIEAYLQWSIATIADIGPQDDPGAIMAPYVRFPVHHRGWSCLGSDRELACAGPTASELCASDRGRRVPVSFLCLRAVVCAVYRRERYRRSGNAGTCNRIPMRPKSRALAAI